MKSQFSAHLGITRAVARSFCLTIFFFVTNLFADVYIAPDGNDANPGTRTRPFATFERARDVMRQPKVRSSGLNVWIKGGDYVRTNALELNSQDSGQPGKPVIWRAVTGEKVRWLGGKLLKDFQSITDPDVIKRFTPDTIKRARQCDLAASGIDSVGRLNSRGFGRARTPAHSELFFGGKPMTLARWPNEGAWDKIAGFPASNSKGDDHGGKIGELPSGFVYAGERPARWQSSTNWWVHGYWAWDWANSYEHVARLDLDQKLIITSPPYGLYGFRSGQRFQFINVLEELDQPGEWFIDEGKMILYFWPPKDPNDHEVLISLLEQPLVRLSQVSHVQLSDIIFEGTRASAIEIKEGESVEIIQCTLKNLGNEGVTIRGGANHAVRSCEIIDTGDGGVSLEGGDRQILVAGRHTVEDCHFQRQGRWSKCYVPAVLISGVGHRVSHCHIHDHPHCAILFTGNDHLIEFNEIDHIALETGDVGAIYTGRDYSYRGNKIRYNYIHETGGVGMGSMGVYMDDCVSGTEVFGNIFYKVHWAMFIGGGRDHRVENNLFVECDPAIRGDARGLDTAPVWRGMVNDYMRKQLAAVPWKLYRERYPEIKTLDAFYGSPELKPITDSDFRGVPPANNRILRNVCFGKWLDIGWHAKAEHFEVQDNYVSPELNKVGSEANGFQLDPKSELWKTGFKSIPWDKIGPRKTANPRANAKNGF